MNTLNTSKRLRNYKSNWMEKVVPGDFLLSDVCMPATHDSGMYNLSGLAKDLAGTQDKDIGQQLRMGIRYFDLRPYFKYVGEVIFNPSSASSIESLGSHFYAYHGSASDSRVIRSIGGSFKSIFSDIKTFMQSEGPNETIFLEFSHFNFGAAPSNLFIQYLRHCLGEYLFTKSEANNRPFSKIPIKDLRGKVVAIFDYTTDGIMPVSVMEKTNDIFVKNNRGNANQYLHNNGKTNDFKIHDNYSNRDKYDGNDGMLAWQKHEFKGFNDDNALFCLCWTLTMQNSTAIWNSLKTVGDKLEWISNPVGKGVKKIWDTVTGNDDDDDAIWDIEKHANEINPKLQYESFFHYSNSHNKRVNMISMDYPSESVLDVCQKIMEGDGPMYSERRYPHKTNTLHTNQKLQVGEYLTSSNNKLLLTLQTDGNLVLVDRTGDVKWASGTPGRTTVNNVSLHGDGYLFFKDNDTCNARTENTKWGNRDSYLVVQDDGNVVIYNNNDPIWDRKSRGLVYQGERSFNL